MANLKFLHINKINARFIKWSCFIKKTIISHSEIFIYLFVFLINILGIIQIKILTISDETGTIANAAFLAGMDWSNAFSIAGTNFYKYGQALLYLPLYLIFSNPYIIYKCALILNALLISVIPVLSFKIFNNFLSMDKLVSVVGAIMIGVLPSYLLWSKMLWAETLLFLLPWVIIYLIGENIILKNECNNKVILNSFMIGFISFFAYMVHSRGIVIFLATLFTILIISLIEKTKIVNFIPYFIAIVCSIFFDFCISNYLNTTLWMNRETNNSLSNMVEVIKQYDLFGFMGVKALSKLALGWLFHVINSTYGMAFVGVVLCILFFKSYIKGIRNKNLIVNYIYIFIFLLFLGSFTLGMLFFVNVPYEIFYLEQKNRFDKVIYGRYLGSSFGPLILLFYYEVFHIKSANIKKIKHLAGRLILFINGVFLLFYTDYLVGSTFAILHICDLPFFFPVTDKVVGPIKDDILFFVLGIIFVCTITFFIIKKASTGIGIRKRFVLFIITLFIITYLWSILTYFRPVSLFYDKQLTQTMAVLEKCENLYEEFPYISCMVDKGLYSYQFVFQDYLVVTGAYAMQKEITDVLLVDDEWNINKNYNKGDYFIVINEDSYSNLVVKGERLKEKIESYGLKTELINN